MSSSELDTRWLYTLLVGLVALERGIELLLSSRNARRMLDRGGIETGAEHYPVMVTLHSLFLVACPLEIWWMARPWSPLLGVPMLLLLALTMVLRYWVILTLGERWNTRIIHVPGLPLIDGGPFRWMRHPNYLAVALELVALPLIHGAWLTAVLFGAGNVAVLRVRIRKEDAALGRVPGLAGDRPG